MRLLAVRGENLTSLAAPFELRLDAPPLATAGLFAITGPTGAGKSTLLDAICLALFDALPRLSDVENQSEIGDPGAPTERRLRYADPRGALRHGAGAGHAEVEFQGRDGRFYVARWDVWRARKRAGGALQPQTVTLTDRETGARIGDKKTDTLAEISDRLGLSFDQFRRAALLAQGDFDAFLAAKAADRAELLERITGAEIYARTSQAAHRRAAEERAEIAKLEAQLGEHEPLSPEQRSAAEDALRLAEEALGQTTLAEERARRALDWRRAWDKLDQEFQTLDRRRADALAHERTAATTTLFVARREEEDLQADLDACDAWLERFSALGALAADLNTVLEAVHARGAAAQGLKALSAARQKTANDIARLEKGLQDERARLAGAEEHLSARRDADAKARAASEVYDLATLSKQLEIAADRVRALDQLAELQTQTTAETTEIQRLQEIVRTSRENIANAATRHDVLSTSLNLARARLDEAIAALRRWETADGDAAKALRAALESQQPCPVCGSVDHAVDIFQAEIERARAAQLSAVDDAEAERQRLTDEILASDRLKQSNAERIHEAETEAQRREEKMRKHVQLSETLAQELGLVASTAPDIAAQRSRADATRAERQADLAKAETLLAALAAARRALDAAAEDQRTASAAVLEVERSLAAARETRVADEAEGRRLHETHLAAETALGRWLDELNPDWRQDDEAELTERCQGAARRFGEKQSLRVRTQERLRALSDIMLAATTLTEDGDGETAAVAEMGASPEQTTQRSVSADAALEEAQTSRRKRLELEGRAAQAGEAIRAHKAAIPEGDALSISLSEIEAAATEAHKRSERARAAGEDARRTILNDNETRNRIGRLADALEKRRAGAEVWTKLDALIGSADGSKFRRYAQAVTLRRLVALANLKLEDLQPRYRLACAPDATPERPALALQVVDRDMGDEIRGAHNLSGGERFLVSLALALGLATLSSDQGVRVETLFIDEGFGALDGESLSMAVSALEALQATGRLVGVISHVEELKERIPVQVAVTPEGGGRSRLEVRVR
ncbi:MAG: AAA family ATPase [Pseudomonadota bacterium]